jgi:hypothetical protein
VYYLLAPHCRGLGWAPAASVTYHPAWWPSRHSPHQSYLGIPSPSFTHSPDCCGGRDIPIVTSGTRFTPDIGLLSCKAVAMRSPSWQTSPDPLWGAELGSHSGHTARSESREDGGCPAFPTGSNRDGKWPLSAEQGGHKNPGFLPPLLLTCCMISTILLTSLSFHATHQTTDSASLKAFPGSSPGCHWLPGSSTANGLG